MDVLKTKERFRRTAAVFSGLDKFLANKGLQTTRTERGVYQTIRLPVAFAIAIDQYMHDNKDPNGKNVFDAGSGSGIIIAAMAALGYNAFGIECQPDLARYSKNVLDGLNNMLTYEGRIAITQGNFLEEASYMALDLPFHTIDTFVHTVNTIDIELLIDKIAEEAKPGSQLLLVGGGSLEMVADAYGRPGKLELDKFHDLPIEASFSAYARYTKI